MTCGIYCIKNLINNKKYIGKAVDIAKRWQSHKHRLKNNFDSKYLQNAYNKYGKDSFEFYVLCECEIENLDDREKYYINLFKTFGFDGKFGYNLTEGGGGSSGFSHSEESKLKMSIANSSENSSWFGKTHSQETKDKMSKSNSGENHRLFGNHPSEETREKMSNTRMGDDNHRFDKKLPGASSQYLGVYFDKTRGNWKVYVIVNKNRIYIGTSDDERVAAKMYDSFIMENNIDRKLNFLQ